MGNLKALRLRVLAIVVSCVVTLIAGEGVTRSYERLIGVDFGIQRKELLNADRLPRDLWLQGDFPRLRPNARVIARTSEFEVGYAINGHGLRDREYSYQRVPGKIRILALGDSFTFGEGVPYGERFVDIPEDYFANLEIITLAVPGYGIEHELICLYQEGLKYSPDFVILFVNQVDTRRWLSGLFEGTHISLNGLGYENNRLGETAGTVYLPRERNASSRVEAWLQHWHTFEFLAGRLDLYRLARRDSRIWKDKAPFRDDSDRVGEPSAEIRERTIRVLDKYREITASRGIQFLVINIDAHYDLSYIQGAFRDLAYFDLSAALSKRAAKTPLRFLYDRHFNPRTHRFLGESLIEIFKTSVPRLQVGTRAASVPK
jgi:hypothetical protein